MMVSLGVCERVCARVRGGLCVCTHVLLAPVVGGSCAQGFPVPLLAGLEVCLLYPRCCLHRARASVP